MVEAQGGDDLVDPASNQYTSFSFHVNLTKRSKIWTIERLTTKQNKTKQKNSWNFDKTKTNYSPKKVSERKINQVRPKGYSYQIL